MKIGFLAYSTRQLDLYWEKLQEFEDCWWGVTMPGLYEELKKRNIKNIVYNYDEHFLDKNIKSGNKYKSKNPGLSEKIIAEKINPDMWISQYPKNLHYLSKKNYWVQVFSTLPLKKYFFYKSLRDYDLILLPGEYYKQETIKRLNFDEKEQERLKVVGWPLGDTFVKKKFDRLKVLNKLGLNPEKKTIMYAPTWGVWNENSFLYGHDKLFARWFGSEIDIFKQLCKFLKDNNMNFIVRLHCLSTLHNDPEIIKIAKEYNVFFDTKPISRYLEDPYEHLSVTDILISDLSGITTDYLFLNKPIIYIDPDDQLLAWNGSDMPKNFRAGHIVKTPTDLFNAIEESLRLPQKFNDERKMLLSKLIYKSDTKAINRGAQEIMNFAYNKGLIKKRVVC